MVAGGVQLMGCGYHVLARRVR